MSEDLTNKIFNRLTVIQFSHKDKRSEKYWKCKCICGNIKIVKGSHIKSNRIKSCGCLRDEKISKLTLKHGNSGKNKSKEYECWLGMKKRCYSSNDKSYKNYGGRGITVCDKWETSFENFLNDMGEKPEPKEKYTIERLNNNKNYEPENCIWVTRIVQNNNRRNVKLIKINNIEKTISQWARLINKNYHTVYYWCKNGTMEYNITKYL